MKKHITRRQFINSGLLVGTGVGLSLAGANLMPTQAQSPTATPQGDGGTDEIGMALSGSIRRIHDPVVIKGEDAYYLFCTGAGIPMRRSEDLIKWEIPFPPVVFAKMPDWARQAIPGQNDFWAPDISFFNNKYHLYYAVSTFGKNRSVIGLATNVTLNPKDPNYDWVDEGMVTESVATNNYNCIDPNLAIDAEGQAWLSFGSFWSGIKMRKLDFATGKLSTEDTKLYSLATRFVNSGAIEAPFIIRKGEFYYQFASFDFCCQGEKSTYHVVVGRSEKITGPYVDKDSKEMTKGGGTQITFPTERWKGPGHNGIVRDGDTDYIVFHSYDAANLGVPTLKISKLAWDAEGWPSLEA